MNDCAFVVLSTGFFVLKTEGTFSIPTLVDWTHDLTSDKDHNLPDKGYLPRPWTVDGVGGVWEMERGPDGMNKSNSQTGDIVNPNFDEKIVPIYGRDHILFPLTRLTFCSYISIPPLLFP